jgi:hypothetical protein
MSDEMNPYVPSDYGSNIKDAPIGESDDVKFSAYIDNEILFSISNDGTWAVLEADIYTINPETKEITFSDNFLNALSEQLSERIRRQGISL